MRRPAARGWPGATVPVVSAAGGQLGRATSDAAGRYAVEPASSGRPYLLVVRAAGTAHAEHLGAGGPLTRDLDLAAAPAPVA